MGLDMYLSAERWMFTIPDGERERVVAAIRALPIPGIASLTPKKVVCELLYWRKANQIHAWFVEQVQSGQDNCESYDVSRDHLKLLLDTCKQVKQDPAQAAELLPTQSGFFFGGTDYDEDYLQDIDDTIVGLEKILADHDLETGWYFNYTSSW